MPSVELPRFMEAAAGQYATAKVRQPFTFIHYFPSEGIGEQQAELTCCTLEGTLQSVPSEEN